MSSSRSTRWSSALLAGAMAAVALVGAAVVQHDLPAHRSVGVQARAERHRRASTEHASDKVGRCIDAVPIDRRRCAAADDKRDRDFFRAVPHKK